MTQRDERNILIATVDLERKRARALRLAIDVLRGPDPELRAEAVDSLGRMAQELEESVARLGELIA